MMIRCISPLLSPSNPNTLDDWILELGEKAFLAWLRFHSWKEGQASVRGSFLLPFSLNKVIQRLKMGKSTFYKKVLNPLLHVGLIEIQPAAHSSQELRILVHGLPESTDHAEVELAPALPSSPLLPAEDDHSYANDTPQATEPADNSSPQPFDQMKTEPTQPTIITVDTPSIRMEPHPAQTPATATQQKSYSRSAYTIDSLPVQLQHHIQHDPRFLERQDGIIQAYHQCREHPSFCDEDFIHKMQTCIRYVHHKDRFGAYLQKSLLNEWNKPSRRTSEPIHRRPIAFPQHSSPQPPIPPDLPEWVWRQQQRQSSDQASDKHAKLRPEQQAEADFLLRQLEALGS